MAGRPRYVPTDEVRRQVEFMVSVGTAHERIADFLKISKSTLKSAFKDELKSGKLKVEQALASKVFTNAMKGNQRAAEYLLSTKFGYKMTVVNETHELDLAGATDEELEILRKFLRNRADQNYQA